MTMHAPLVSSLARAVSRVGMMAMAWIGLLICTPALADDLRDHERARAALQAGEILPLQQVLARVSARHPGEVLEVELEREDGRWVYELKLLQRDGLLVRLDVDARTGEVLARRPRPQTPPPAAPSSPPSRPARQP